MQRKPDSQNGEFRIEALKPADLLPPDGLAQLRELRWVMGDTVVELAGIGWYHAGPTKRGLMV